jgi:hypothetical protein
MFLGLKEEESEWCRRLREVRRRRKVMTATAKISVRANARSRSTFGHALKVLLSAGAVT